MTSLPVIKLKSAMRLWCFEFADRKSSSGWFSSCYILLMFKNLWYVFEKKNSARKCVGKHLKSWPSGWSNYDDYVHFKILHSKPHLAIVYSCTSFSNPFAVETKPRVYLTEFRPRNSHPIFTVSPPYVSPKISLTPWKTLKTCECVVAYLQPLPQHEHTILILKSF